MKIIIFCLSGIGNTILFTPVLRALRESYPNAQTILLAAKAAFAEPVRGSAVVDDIVVFEQGPILDKIALLWRLRKARYDFSITAFPSNKWQHNLFAFLVGAKNRITHSYKVARLRTLSFLQNTKVQAVEDVHDVQQNLNLLEPLGIISGPGTEKKLLFHLSDEEIGFASDFWNENALGGEFVVGVHPGCNRKNPYKRWPEDSFVELISKLIAHKNARVILFAGPDEESFVQGIYRQIEERAKTYLIERTGLKKVAALISRCNCFICTDSGLGHIAAALRVRTLAIFGPAMHTRVSPYGKTAHIVRTGIECSPCLKYPFYATHSNIKCDEGMRCLKELRVATVFKALESVLYDN